MKRGLVRLLALLVFCAVLGPAVNLVGEKIVAWRYPDQRLADAVSWRFKPEEATLDFCAKRPSGEYKVECQESGEYSNERITVTFTRRDGTIAYSQAVFSSNGYIFQIVGDRLYTGSFLSCSEGCKVAAINLQDGRKLWSRTLIAVGCVAHSAYNNKVNLDADSRTL